MTDVSDIKGPGRGLPPGPPLPSFVQAAWWALRPLSLMDRAAARYGHIFTLRVRRGRPWVFLTDPDLVKKVFTADADLMRAGAGEANPLLKPLLGPRSVMLLDEPEHMGDRRRLLPSFHGSRMTDYGDMMEAVALEQISTWPLGEPFPLWPRMQAISLEVVMRAVFGEEVHTERLELLRKRVVEMTAWINHPRRLTMLAALGERSITSGRGFRRAMSPVEELVLEEVRERRANPRGDTEAEDILTMLDRAYGRGEESGSEGKLRDELVTMLSDGPTATSLAWVFERLVRRPEKFQRLREEVLAGESEEYLDAVVKETLRLCPTVPVVMRRLAEPIELDGYEMPPDTVVAPCVYLMHLREDIYPNATVFEPERFLGQPAGTYTWIPFGGGVRRCVAAQFAPLEMRRVIKAVIEQVELRPADERLAGAKRSSVSFAPSSGAMMIALPRRREALAAH